MAEAGVKQDDATVFHETEKALKKYLPNLDTANLEWSALPVVRVEGYDPRGWLPDRPSYQKRDNVTLGWVNKLTLAPFLAKEIMDKLPPRMDLPEEHFALPAAPIAPNPWDTASWQKI